MTTAADPIREHRQALLKLALASLERLPCPVDEEDLDVLETAVGDFIRGTQLVPPSAPVLAGGGALICPMFASESLAKFARFAEALEPAGARVLSAQVVLSSGELVTRNHPKARDLIVAPSSPAAKFWDRWSKQCGPGLGVALSASESLTEDGFAISATEPAVRLWMKSMEPALTFGMRGLASKEQARNIAFFEQSVGAPAKALLERALALIGENAWQAVRPENSEIVLKSPLRSVGLYNYLAAPPAEGANPEWVQRNRVQALSSMRNITGLLATHTIVPGLSSAMRAAVDRGTQMVGLLADHFKAKPAHIKAFLSSKLDLDQGRALEIDSNWIHSYVAMVEALPAARLPKTDVDVAIARELNVAAPAIEALSHYTLTSPATLWEGVLKQGWEPAVQALVALQVGEVPANLLARARFGAEAVSELASSLNLLRAAYDYVVRSQLTPTVFTEAEFLSTLLRDKTIKTMGEYLRPLRTLIPQAEAAALASANRRPTEAVWTPLMGTTRQITIGDVTVTELLNGGDLELESQHMHHCVRGYTETCLREGSRIFAFRRGSGAAHSETSGTLELRIAPDCQTFRMIQFRSIRNNAPAEALQAARQAFMDGLVNAEFPCNLDGYRQDRLRGFGIQTAGEAAAQAKFAVVDQGIGFMLPKAARNLTLTAYLNSPSFREELDVVRKHTARLAEEAALKAAEGAVQAEAASMGM